MLTLILPLFNITSLLLLAMDFGFFPGAFACDGDTALLNHPESPRSDLLHRDSSNTNPIQATLTFLSFLSLHLVWNMGQFRKEGRKRKDQKKKGNGIVIFCQIPSTSTFHHKMIK